VAQELPEAKPEVQSQIGKTFEMMNRLGVVTFDNVEVIKEAQEVKRLAGDDIEAVRQLATYIAETESVEDSHAVIALSVWRYLNVSPKATIGVLAPYLDSGNRALRGFVDDLFDGQEYEDFRDYARRQNEVPAPFVEYLFKRSPGEALQILQAGSVDTAAHVRIAREKLGATGDAIKPSPLEGKIVRASQGRRETLLAEHIVANALWLKKNGFKEQFREALPEAQEELTKLSKSKKWWARRYVVEIMRRNPELLMAHVMEELRDDENPLVSEAAKAGRSQ